MRLKNIKRLSAVFLSFMLAAAITFGTVAATTLINGTDAENEATPKYYSAVKDWSAENNTENSDNVFSYQFALDGNEPMWDYMTAMVWGYWYTGDTDYTNFKDLTETEWSSKYKADTFKHATGIGPKGFMRLWNRFGGFDLLDSIPATALTYTAKEDGYVNIATHTVSMFSTYFTSGYGYRALLRITKNGENVYPESGYLVIDETTTFVNIEELDISVNAGDDIRFELTSDTSVASSHSIGISWNPALYVRPQQELYTDTTDIYNDLTHFMKTVFSGLTGQTMDGTDALTLAKENSKRSKYGVYTAMDSVYSGGVIPSSEDSVWKYATAAAVPDGFETPIANYGLKCENTENGTSLSWDSAKADGLKAVLVAVRGKKYTYMSPDGARNIELPVSADTSGSFTVQVSGENGASEIVKVTADGMETVINADNADTVIYLDSSDKSGSGVTATYTLSNEAAYSTYSVRYALDAVKSEETANNRRTVIFSANADEQMLFGFTAPQGGDYEIIAPIEVKNDSDVKYSVLKQDKNGTFTVIDGPRNYSTDKSGYAALLSLKAGETVWLNAVSDTETEIHIGIPRVTLKEETTDSDGTAAYKYRAVDYVESDYFNNKAYGTASLTEKAGAVWEFGSFENPIETADGVTDNDTLGYMNYTKGDDASKLTAVLKPYEVIRKGKWYNPLAMVVNADGAVSSTYSYGGVGTLHATLGTSYSASGAHREIGMPYQNKGFMVAVGLGNGKDGKTHNMGIYMKFTAPVSGNVTLNLSDFAEARTACRVLIIKGDTVVQAYGSIPLRAVVDLGYMNKGQSVCICYGTNSENIYNYGGSPIATVSGEKVTVSFNNSLAFEAQQTDYLMTYGDKFVLSDKADEIGKTILGWKDELGDYYAVGEEYTAESDITFDADQRYFGDLDGDSDINASDITSMRKDILSGDTNILAVSDVNTDGTFDIRDLVRMKKWLAGLSIAFNEQ